jgi:hypothetical protein
MIPNMKFHGSTLSGARVMYTDTLSDAGSELRRLYSVNNWIHESGTHEA